MQLGSSRTRHLPDQCTDWGLVTVPRGADRAEAGNGSPPLRVGDREARADRQGGEVINRIAASLPIRELLFVEALGDVRLPFAGHRPDHRARVELAAIDAHRAAEAAADLEGRFDDGVAREARRDRFEISDFAGRAAAGHSVSPRSVSVWRSPILCGQNDKTVLPRCLLPW
jgi:hypothetical protein